MSKIEIKNVGKVCWTLSRVPLVTNVSFVAANGDDSYRLKSEYINIYTSSVVYDGCLDVGVGVMTARDQRRKNFALLNSACIICIRGHVGKNEPTNLYLLAFRYVVKSICLNKHCHIQSL